MFSLAESFFRSPLVGREDEKSWLFETLPHNLTREPGEEAIFLFFSRATH
jgi:hypothetical protein